MPTFEAKMRVTYIETWTVEAEDEVQARLKLDESDDAVDTGDPGFEVVDWAISSLQERA